MQTKIFIKKSITDEIFAMVKITINFQKYYARIVNLEVFFTATSPEFAHYFSIFVRTHAP
jgi:hypothetical protein